MNKQERIAKVAQHESPDVDQLAEQYGVSTATIYRDLAEIDMRGQAFNAGTTQAEVGGDSGEGFAAGMGGNQSLMFDQHMVSGIEYHGGQVNEEFQRELQDDGGVRIFTEMATNPVVAAVLFAIEMAQRQVSWMVEPGGEDKKDTKAAEFLEGCLDDMSATFDDVVSQVFSMLVYGYAVAEIIYKKRLGQKPKKYTQDPAKSRYDDGLIGWRRWQFISPKSMPAGNRWAFDEYGRVQAVHQQASPDYTFRTLPMEKALLFRTTTKYDNPEGLSILRAQYMPWYYQRNLSEVEAISAERMGAGFPVMYLGEGPIKKGNNNDFEQSKNIVRNIRVDEQMGMVIPFPKLGTAAPGHGVLFELVSPPSRGGVNFHEVIERYEKRMAMVVLGQFIFLGMTQIGAQALNQSATDTFQMSIGAWSDMVADVINRFAVPRLMALNPFKLQVLPKVTHSLVGVPDLQGMADFINKLVGSQIIEPDQELENYLREMANLPEKQEIEIDIVPGLEDGGEEGDGGVEGEGGAGVEPEDDEGPEEPEDADPEVEIDEDAGGEFKNVERFALKTIAGALARDMQTGEFAKGTGKALSDEDVRTADGLAFGRMSGHTARMFANKGLLEKEGDGFKYTEKGSALARQLRQNPHAGVDKMQKMGILRPKQAAGKIQSEGGGGGGGGDKSAGNRKSVGEALANKGIESGHLDALDGMKGGTQPDEALSGKLQELGLVEQAGDDMVMTAKGRSLLGAGNSGDVDKALAALAKEDKGTSGKGKANGKDDAGKKGAGGKAKKKAPSQGKGTPFPPGQVNRGKKLMAQGMEEGAASELLMLSAQDDPQAYINKLGDAKLSKLVDAGILQEGQQGGHTMAVKGTKLLDLLKGRKWADIKKLLGGKDEVASEPQEELFADRHVGAMVAFVVPPEFAKTLALNKVGEGSKALPADGLHLTLAYLGDSAEIAPRQEETAVLVSKFAVSHPPIKGVIGGTGTFDGGGDDGENAFYASFDSPDLPAFRQTLVEWLGVIGHKIDTDHGFTPHITLAYLAEGEETPALQAHPEIEFKQIALYWGEHITTYDLENEEDYGGAGSGNWGHKGVPGQRGGSAPAGAGVRVGGAAFDPGPERDARRAEGFYDVISETDEETAKILLTQGIEPSFKPDIPEVGEYAPGRGAEREGLYVANEEAFSKGSFGRTRLYLSTETENLKSPIEMRQLGRNDLGDVLGTENGAVTEGFVPKSAFVAVETHQGGKWVRQAPAEYLKSVGVDSDTPKLPTVPAMQAHVAKNAESWHLSETQVSDFVHDYNRASLEDKVWMASDSGLLD